MDKNNQHKKDLLFIIPTVFLIFVGLMFFTFIAILSFSLKNISLGILLTIFVVTILSSVIYTLYDFVHNN